MNWIRIRSCSQGTPAPRPHPLSAKRPVCKEPRISPDCGAPCSPPKSTGLICLLVHLLSASTQLGRLIHEIGFVIALDLICKVVPYARHFEQETTAGNWCHLSEPNAVRGVTAIPFCCICCFVHDPPPTNTTARRCNAASIIVPQIWTQYDEIAVIAAHSYDPKLTARSSRVKPTTERAETARWYSPVTQVRCRGAASGRDGCASPRR